MVPSFYKQSKHYNPSDVGVKGSLFGLPFDEENAKIAILPVPWDVTASSIGGSSKAPEAILDISTQIDLEVLGVEDAWRCAPYLLPISQEWKRKNDELRALSKQYILWLETGSNEKDKALHATTVDKINNASEQLNQWVKKQTAQLLNKKAVGLLGGDHSCCLGLLEALCDKYHSFGILHLDAHADMRCEYEGFTSSHASIIYNALKFSTIKKCVQVGIRDYSKEELLFIDANPKRLKTYFDERIKEQMMEGVTWQAICKDIIEQLPQNVYISFDIDSLSLENCPNTGTPVPGGLSYDMATYLLKQLRGTNKKIIGFDLCEVVPHKSTIVNETVATKLLLQLCLLL